MTSEVPFRRRAIRRFVANTLTTMPIGEYTDPSTEGLQFRVRAARGGLSRTWLFRFTWRSEWVRKTIGHHPATSLVEARETAQALRKRLSQGIDPRDALPRRRGSPEPSAQLSPQTHKPYSVEHLVAEYMDFHVRPSRKRPEQVLALLRKDVLSEWAGRDVRTITPREVIELLDKIVARGSRVVANRVAGILGQMFKLGIHRTLVEVSPVQLLYRPGGKERARDRTLSDKELTAFLADPRACTRYERLEHVILALLLTGQRRGELALARWRDVKLQDGTWIVPAENSKSGRAHTVPLSEWAVETFRALKRQGEGSPFVIPADPGGKLPIDPKQLTRSLAKCRARFKKAGIAPFTLHDLRRTCRTGLARLKVAPHIAERVLNHAQEKIAGTYDTHDYLDEKREALERWATHLATLKP